MPGLRVGIIAFSHAPVYATAPEREAAIREGVAQLVRLVQSVAGAEAVNALDELNRTGQRDRYGASDAADASLCVRALKSAAVDALIVGVFQFPRSSLIPPIVRELNVPTALYTPLSDEWPGEAVLPIIHGALLEEASSPYALLAERFRGEAQHRDLVEWLRGLVALRAMRRGRVMVWGGYYGADIPTNSDDGGMMHGRLIGEVLTEQEIVLVERARRIQQESPDRIDRFYGWMTGQGARVTHDGKVSTPQVLQFQIAQYLAARDRLRELQSEGVLGVSVKCHWEMSTTVVGCTECLLPAFLPFPEDADGSQPIVPVSCESDVKGLLSAVLLHRLRPDVPPLFGDLLRYRSNRVVISNCGAASVYWAGRSNVPAQTLSRVELLPQVHGKTGSTVTFNSPGSDAPVTMARLFRVGTDYYLFFGLGRLRDDFGEGRLKHGSTWPQTFVEFPEGDSALFYQTVPTNHTTLTEGDHTRALEYFCRYAGVTPVRFDRPDQMRAFLDRLQQKAGLHNALPGAPGTTGR